PFVRSARPSPTPSLFPYTTLFRSDLGRGLREVRVDLFPHAEAAGHGGNDQRRLKTLPEEFHAQIDIVQVDFREGVVDQPDVIPVDRKSTRLNSSHQIISYAVFCLK